MSKLSSFKQNAIVATEKATSGIFGVLHFGAQTTADLLAEGESRLLSINKRNDRAKIKANRIATTKLRQQYCLDNLNKFREKVSEASNQMVDKYHQFNAGVNGQVVEPMNYGPQPQQQN